MKISIVIRSYNEIRYFPKLITAIKNQNGYSSSDVEIILVDSGSDDGTLEYGKLHCDKVECILKDEFSFGRSLNIGCKVSEGEFIVLISAHCVPVDCEWLANLVKPFHDKKIGVTYGRQIGGEETRFSEHQIFSKYFPADVQQLNNLEYYCNNANCAIRNDLWKERKYDEELSGLEDMDFAKWCFKEKKLKIHYRPDATVYHFHHESWKSIRRRFEREANALALISPDSIINISSALKYLIVAITNDLKKSLKEKTITQYAGEILFYRICQYYGSYKGGLYYQKLSSAKRRRYYYP